MGMQPMADDGDLAPFSALRLMPGLASRLTLDSEWKEDGVRNKGPSNDSALSLYQGLRSRVEKASRRDGCSA
jgi:hypothetical protein